jgi:hypothetical protein
MSENWHKRHALSLASQLPENASDANGVIRELQHLVDSWLHPASFAHIRQRSCPTSRQGLKQPQPRRLIPGGVFGLAKNQNRPDLAFRARLFLCLQHISLTAIGLRHIQVALGDIGVCDGPRHTFSLSRLLPKKFGFLHHRTI